jgi:hypothetical protein
MLRRAKYNAMMLQELLYRYLNGEDIKGILLTLDLSTSGSESEQLDRLEMVIRGMPAKKVLSYFPRSALLGICNDNGIQSHSVSTSSDEELIRRICSKVLTRDRPKLDGHPWMR